MAVKGIFVSDAGALDERSGNFPSTILASERGGSVPMFALSAGMSSEDISSTECTWYEENLMYHRTSITMITDPQGVQLQVEDASWIHENQIFMVESTGEYISQKLLMVMY